MPAPHIESVDFFYLPMPNKLCTRRASFTREAFVRPRLGGCLTEQGRPKWTPTRSWLPVDVQREKPGVRKGGETQENPGRINERY
ncbi:MAG: hypothetical protein RI906_2190 [Pseudomonadota bacterium]|jgi:hypothetical protein